MNAVSAIVPANWYRQYEAEHEENRKLYSWLDRSLTLLEVECRRRELRGEDVAHVRAFVANARKEALS